MNALTPSRRVRRAIPGQLDLFVLLDTALAVAPPETAAALIEALPLPITPAYYLDGARELPRGALARAQANLDAIRLSAELAAEGRAPSVAEQARLALFTAYGASELANNAFLRPGEHTFRPGWESLGHELRAAISPTEYAALARGTQYAHFTPELIARAMWQGVERIGFAGGAVLEPGCGAGMFPSLTPPGLRAAVRFTGIEADPTTARIARLLHPGADIRQEDFALTNLPPHFSLAIGNPPFSSRVVRNDPVYRALAMRLHDFFIVKALDLLLPGGLAAFVTSQGTLDKADDRVRSHIAASCDLLGAIRLPEGAFRASAGTDVGVDLLFLRKPLPGEPRASRNWIETSRVGIAAAPDMEVNRWFVDHPDMVLGEHLAVKPGPHSARRSAEGLAYACKPLPGRDLANDLALAIGRLPKGLAPAVALAPMPEAEAAPIVVSSSDNDRLREGSYFVGADRRLMQALGGQGVPVPIRSRNTDGIYSTHAELIRALIPVRDAVRAVLRAQERRQCSKAAQERLGQAYDVFVAKHGPINKTDITYREPDADGRRAEIHRQPNIAPFADDPDCWLVASIEDYDIEAGTAAKGLIFTGQVLTHRAEPEIRTAGDALARCLHERGAVDLPLIAGFLGTGEAEALAALGDTVFRNPATGCYETADGYLAGRVRDKLALAIKAADADPAFRRNVEALELVQPTDIPPSDITARLGAPWIPAAVVEAFALNVLGLEARIEHNAATASWLIKRCYPSHARRIEPLRWGTLRHESRKVLDDALNFRTPQIYDTIKEGGKTTSILNVADTEAAKEKLASVKAAFEHWVWTCPGRSEELARIYNDTFNNLVTRRFDGSHLRLPGASAAFKFRPHQLNVIWRMICGEAYVAHAVGAGKSACIAAAIMEQRRLGLTGKAVLTVPGHCLAQAAREFLAVYPCARIMVADEQNFAKDKRRKFLARAATGDWDCLLITHSAFKFIPVPVAFEREMVEEAIAEHAALIEDSDRDDRLTRKRLEAKKEAFAQRLEALMSRKDDFLTMAEIGIDQIYVDEAQEFRKLSFVTNMTTLKGVDSDGSQMAWDLFVKASFVRADRRAAAEGAVCVDRALYMASGTPVTNTLGELYTLQRFMGADELRERGLHEFDAWAGSFGETRTDLELQPSGKYKPVTRFSQFVNVPELIAMFRQFADVVLSEELGKYVPRPPLRTGKRQLLTAPPSAAFKDYQRLLDARIKAIEARRGKPKPGEDIILSVIGDGRHAAIDLRFVLPGHENEAGNKLNLMIGNVLRLYREGEAREYLASDGVPYARRGSTQMIFSDLGTLSVEASRGFSAYRWIRDQLIAGGIPASEIAIAQECKDAKSKARLFANMRAGLVRIALGSTKKMGTGANAQNRLAALHHLDVPWLPSDIAQREGRIERQGNQNEIIDIFAYATEGSMDAQMWQANERKARFIAAALSGDRSVRRLEDMGEGAANQFAMAKAIASGDPRLMQQAGLAAEVARLERLRSAHYDEQHNLRARIRGAERRLDQALKTIPRVEASIAARGSRDEPWSIVVAGAEHFDRKDGGKALTDAMRRANMDAAGRFNGVEGRVIASIRGFEISYSARLSEKNDLFCSATLHTGHGDIDLRARSVTAGATAFDQVVEAACGFESELRTHRAIAEEAEAVLERHKGSVGGRFELDGELALKREELEALNAALAADSDETQTPGKAA